MNDVGSLCLIASGGGLLLLLLWGALREGGRGRPGLRPVRRRLERGLSVGVRDRRLLARLARALGLEDHTPLLLGRGCFEAAVRALDPPDDLLVRVESLRRRLHGGSESASGTNTADP